MRTSIAGIVLTCCLGASAAEAADYYVGGQNDVMVNLVDASTVKIVRSGVRRAWVTTINLDSDYAYSIALREFNCTDETYRALSFTSYDYQGKPLSTAAEQPFQFAVPESVGGITLKLACSPLPVVGDDHVGDELPLQIRKRFAALRAGGPKQ